jgi:hypothetical protein
MSIIDLTSESYSDVTYTRTITARQLAELPASEVVALKVTDRDAPEHSIWVRIDAVIMTPDPSTGRPAHVIVSYNDEWMGSIETDQFFYLNDKIEIAMVS